MLRITTDTTRHALMLRLEGRLEGPWVAVLEECFGAALSKRRERRLCVDLNGVTFVDAQGKARLAEMHAQGAELLGGDIETKAIVAEVCAGRADNGGKASQVSNHNPANIDSEQLMNLQRLQAELHEVNCELATAARPLDRISELNEQQRQHVGDQLRAGLARWESVTQRIAQELGLDGHNGKSTEAHEGGSR